MRNRDHNVKGLLEGLCRNRGSWSSKIRVKHFPQAHSTIVPPSSLCPPRRWSGAEGGGSWNVEGCWEFSYLKIQRLQNFHFMFIDRYEIHIQDFEVFYGNLHHFPVPAFDFSTFRNPESRKFIFRFQVRFHQV